MANIKNYIVFDSEGVFQSFHNSINVITDIYGDKFSYCEIDVNVMNALLGLQFTVKKDMILSSLTKIDSIRYFNIIEKSADDEFTEYVSELLNELKRDSDMYAQYGVSLMIHGTYKVYHYSMSKCQELEYIINTVPDDRTIYYSAAGEFAEEYTKDELVQIHKAIHNNALYNKIYVDRLCNWIVQNFTIDMYKVKDPVISYGYINDEILKEVESRYESSKLL